MQGLNKYMYKVGIPRIAKPRRLEGDGKARFLLGRRVINEKGNDIGNISGDCGFSLNCESKQEVLEKFVQIGRALISVSKNNLQVVRFAGFGRPGSIKDV